jgi:hypothetical protein
MPAIPSNPRSQCRTGRHAKQRADGGEISTGQNPIVLPGIVFEIFSHHDDMTGEDDICLLVDAEGYAKFERRAGLCRMTVNAFAYEVLSAKMKAHGFNISAERFYVTTELPDPGFSTEPGAITRTIN